MVRLTPNGLSVRPRQRAISLVKSSGVGWVSAVMKPSAPALATAATSSARPTHCMPPWTIGCSTPTSSVNRVFSMSALCLAGAHSRAFCRYSRGRMPLATEKVHQGRQRSGQRNHAKGGPFVSAGWTIPHRVRHFRDYLLTGHAADMPKSAVLTPTQTLLASGLRRHHWRAFTQQRAAANAHYWIDWVIGRGKPLQWPRAYKLSS